MEILRKPQETFMWYVIPLLLIVIYIYAKEIQKRQWSIVLAGIAL